MESAATEAAAGYEQALVTLGQHRGATALAAQTATEARGVLAAADPNNPMLQLDQDQLADALSGLNLSPFGALIEIFLAPHYQGPMRGGGPPMALLAGSVALSRVGPGTASVPEILRRVADFARLPGLDRG